MFIEIISSDDGYKNPYHGMVNIEFVHQIKIIRGRHRQYELHINLSNSPSIELLGTKEECEQFYEQLKQILKTHKQLSPPDTLVFPPRSPSKPSADANEEET